MFTYYWKDSALSESGEPELIQELFTVSELESVGLQDERK